MVPSLAQWSEQCAAEYLQLQGYHMLQRNYHSRYGEIDLIMCRADQLVCVEVKARSTDGFGAACEMLNDRKQIKIYKTALSFLAQYPKYGEYNVRFDLICFDLSKEIAKNVQYRFAKRTYDLCWIENAFTLDADLINLC
ncbi:YraN family protein [Acinetobacter larvae]|uniref:UPF0102 protein BFG52_11360 n=1 Tax=Acinetobacter larvae TaxID=1789224 RepID=A0A1B2M448_9GAMM|nr:YraN family protein [Acinetobacter larvae]